MGKTDDGPGVVWHFDEDVDLALSQLPLQQAQQVEFAGDDSIGQLRTEQEVDVSAPLVVVHARAEQPGVGTCRAVLDELARILTRKFRMPGELAQSYGELIEDAAEVITKAFPITTPIPDPDDVPILAASRAGEAECFVTGGKALLELGTLDGMLILSPRQFWEHYRLGR